MVAVGIQGLGFVLESKKLQARCCGFGFTLFCGSYFALRRCDNGQSLWHIYACLVVV